MMFIDAQIVIGAATLLLAIFTVLVQISMKIAKIEAQVLPNSGSSISDKVSNIDRRLAVLEATLER
jgi:hypothetical protein